MRLIVGDNISSIPLLPKIKGLKPITQENIITYLDDMLDMEVIKVNGQEPDCAFINCSFCYSFWHGSEPNYKYVCLDSYEDMYKVCYSERTEEDAIKNGAKNYHKRKDHLNKCFTVNKLIKIDMGQSVYCDECSNYYR